MSTIAVFVIGGALSDKVTMWISKRRGSREPEYQLINLITPIAFAIIGAIVFGYADQFHLHYMVLLLGQFFLMTSPLMAAPIINNYVIESYPQWAGYVFLGVRSVCICVLMLTCAWFQRCFDKRLCAPHIHIFLLQHTSDDLDIPTW